MIRIALLLLISTAVQAQQPQAPVPPPTPDQLAFARLPADIRQRLANLPASQAMQIVAQTGQHAIALGTPQPTPGQFRSTLDAVLGGPGYVSASAGATSFPPLSPLVPPPPPQFLTR